MKPGDLVTPVGMWNSSEQGFTMFTKVQDGILDGRMIVKSNAIGLIVNVMPKPYEHCEFSDRIVLVLFDIGFGFRRVNSLRAVT